MCDMPRVVLVYVLILNVKLVYLVYFSVCDRMDLVSFGPRLL
jgi:hypothetical protein